MIYLPSKFCGKVKYELQVESSDLRVPNSNFTSLHTRVTGS